MLLPKESPPVNKDCAKAWAVVFGLVIAVLVGIAVFRKVSSMRDRAGLAARTTHLRQINLALMNYSLAYKAPAPAFSLGPDGSPQWGWQVLLLPFLFEDEINARINYKGSWSSVQNLDVARTVPNSYRSPLDQDDESGRSSYVAIIEDTPFISALPPAIIGILEAPTAVPWTKPTYVRLSDVAKSVEMAGDVLVLDNSGQVHVCSHSDATTIMKILQAGDRKPREERQVLIHLAP